MGYAYHSFFCRAKVLINQLLISVNLKNGYWNHFSWPVIYLHFIHNCLQLLRSEGFRGAAQDSINKLKKPILEARDALLPACDRDEAKEILNADDLHKLQIRSTYNVIIYYIILDLLLKLLLFQGNAYQSRLQTKWKSLVYRDKLERANIHMLAKNDLFGTKVQTINL